jgi:hypothetical protein
MSTYLYAPETFSKSNSPNASLRKGLSSQEKALQYISSVDYATPGPFMTQARGGASRGGNLA